MPETHHTFCRICEALCGIEVDTQGDRIVAIRPDPKHVATGGFGCAKGMRQHRLYQSPDRLMTPLRRRGGEFEPCSWDEALLEIGNRVKNIIGEDCADAVAMYVGTAAGFGVLHPVFAQGFMTGLGSRSMYSSATQDCSNKFAVAREIYGFPFTQPFPDLAHTECLIVVGANPAVSKWSFLQVSNPVATLRELTGRGGKLYVVDPRRTETAKAAGEHVFIRPGTDVFFYLSFLHEVLALDAVDHDKVKRHTTGFEGLSEVAAPWPAEKTAALTGIEPAVLREMVRTYVNADGAAIYSSTGVNMGGQGAVAFWLQEVINMITGNLDRAGGTLVGEGVLDFPRFGVNNGVLMRDDRSRVGDFRSVNDAFPGGLLADEILTPGARQVKALFVTGGNPLITMPNAGRLRDALRELELLVVVDIFLNETASEAHFVLPATAPFQRPDLPFIFPLMLGLQSRPYLQATEAVVAPDGEQLDEATIYTRLARACEAPLFGSRAFQGSMQAAMALNGGRIPQKLLLSALLRLTKNGSFRSLARHPHGVARPPHAPGTFLTKRMVTDDQKVQLCPPALVSKVADLPAVFERERRDGRLRLITKRHVLTHNSWTHNEASYSGPQRPTNYLYMHPADAKAVGVGDGEFADVRTEVSCVRIEVKLLDDLMPGVVALPHGWGHQHAKGLSVASKTRGVNVNLLAADGPDQLDRFSGMARLTAIPVEVTPAAGEPVPHSWSGI